MSNFTRVQAIAEQRRARQSRTDADVEQALDAMPRTDAIALMSRKMRDFIAEEQAAIHERAVDGARMQ